MCYIRVTWLYLNYKNIYFWISDIDECLESVCRRPDDICLNTRGNYKCFTIDCPPNYIKDPDHKRYIYHFRLNNMHLIKHIIFSFNLADVKEQNMFAIKGTTPVWSYPNNIPTTS